MLGCKSIFRKITNYIFTASSQPVHFKDLLMANALFNEGIYIDPGKLNFKINLIKTYIVYAIICIVVLVPFLSILHFLFVNVNFHISVISTVLITSCIFIGFDIFKNKTRKYITKKIIKSSWSIHFPYFTYEKYSKQVEALYNKAQKENLSSKEMKFFILNELSQQSND